MKKRKRVWILGVIIGLLCICTAVYVHEKNKKGSVRNMTGGYENQDSWKEIQSFLPKEYQLTEDTMPVEEFWDWNGNSIHLDTYRNPDAKAKVILFHGVGTNGRQMTTIIGLPLAKDGFEIIAMDMPLYGVTKVNPETTITYNDWVQCGNDYINYELSRDDRPIFLYGLSAGGMETYHIACKNKKVNGIIGMTFLDQSSQQVRTETASNFFSAHFGTAMAGLYVKLGLGDSEIQMSMCSKMTALCNNDDCLNAMLNDKTSAGNSVPMKFIYSYVKATPDIEPEDFDICPILLTQPEQDRWTPLALSTPFLDRITNVPVKIVELENGGHYPIEKSALEQLHDYILEFINDNM